MAQSAVELRGPERAARAARPAPMMPALGLGPRLMLGALRLAWQLGGRLAPERAGALAYRQYFSPRRKQPPASEQALRSRAEAVGIPFEGNQKIAYPCGPLAGWRWGSGPLVLLVHGWENRGLWLAEPLLEPLLAAGFQVATFDMPGHGASPGEQSEVMDFALAIERAAAALGPVYAVVAHSLGAAATTIALSRELAAKRAVYLAPACWMLCFPEQFCSVFGLPAPAQRAFYRRLFALYPQELWDGFSADELAARLELPGLIFHDTGDQRTHYQGAQAIQQAWRGSTLVSTEGLGHRQITRDPAVISRTVDFLKEGL